MKFSFQGVNCVVQFSGLFCVMLLLFFSIKSHFPFIFHSMYKILKNLTHLRRPLRKDVRSDKPAKSYKRKGKSVKWLKETVFDLIHFLARRTCINSCKLEDTWQQGMKNIQTDTNSHAFDDDETHWTYGCWPSLYIKMKNTSYKSNLKSLSKPGGKFRRSHERHSQAVTEYFSFKSTKTWWTTTTILTNSYISIHSSITVKNYNSWKTLEATFKRENIFNE